MNTITYDYIYLLQEREFLHQDVNIYKLGKSKQENTKRINTYPKGSKLLLQIICSNCDILEKHLISTFKDTFIHRSDIGNEYFEGDQDTMIHMIIESKKSIDIEHNAIKDTHIEIKILQEKLRELKQEDKLIQIKEQVNKIEHKLKKKQESVIVSDHQQHKISIFDKFEKWVDSNLVFHIDERIALQELVTYSKYTEEAIKKYMKSKGLKYNKDLSGLGKNPITNKAYKGGFEGVGWDTSKERKEEDEYIDTEIKRPIYIEMLYNAPELFCNKTFSSNELYEEAQKYAKSKAKTYAKSIYLLCNFTDQEFAKQILPFVKEFKKRTNTGIIYIFPAKWEISKVLFEADEYYYRYVHQLNKNYTPIFHEECNEENNVNTVKIDNMREFIEKFYDIVPYEKKEKVKRDDFRMAYNAFLQEQKKAADNSSHQKFTRMVRQYDIGVKESNGCTYYIGLKSKNTH
jgi:hypothetical protein